MGFEPEVQSRSTAKSVNFADWSTRKPLVLLRDTERSLRLRTVEALVPVLPNRAIDTLSDASMIADESLDYLAEVNFDAITDRELRPARMQMGLAFIGFGALMVLFLLLYLNTLHPELNAIAQIRVYWHQYVWFVGLGIAGMFMLGREAMRPPD
jgi:hypothetical protein